MADPHASLRSCSWGALTGPLPIKSPETAIGAALFVRRGRHLDPTATGALVLEYAETILRSGEELTNVLRGHAPTRTRTLRVGIVDVMMKLVAFRHLEPLPRCHPSINAIYRHPACNSYPL
ncbi:transcriptional activator NhaR [Planctomycetes bacterium Poly30]|uniref:Transcriptional activator NhaR n=1 Tax=Saltatorellus ferox TaxID=2528018 RepID=A0A518EW50_9BACT|nr:transcriptional activator NhaR [Planctomycetes bacterium Poly30]